MIDKDYQDRAYWRSIAVKNSIAKETYNKRLKYMDYETAATEVKGIRKKKRIKQSSKDGYFVKIYESLSEAAKESGHSHGKISNLYNGAATEYKGHIWERVID